MLQGIKYVYCRINNEAWPLHSKKKSFPYVSLSHLCSHTDGRAFETHPLYVAWQHRNHFFHSLPSNPPQQSKKTICRWIFPSINRFETPSTTATHLWRCRSWRGARALGGRRRWWWSHWDPPCTPAWYWAASAIAWEEGGSQLNTLPHRSSHGQSNYGVQSFKWIVQIMVYLCIQFGDKSPRN